VHGCCGTLIQCGVAFISTHTHTHTHSRHQARRQQEANQDQYRQEDVDRGMCVCIFACVCLSISLSLHYTTLHYHRSTKSTIPNTSENAPYSKTPRVRVCCVCVCVYSTYSRSLLHTFSLSVIYKHTHTYTHTHSHRAYRRKPMCAFKARSIRVQAATRPSGTDHGETSDFLRCHECKWYVCVRVWGGGQVIRCIFMLSHTCIHSYHFRTHTHTHSQT
jgi:hypothetical protein